MLDRTNTDDSPWYVVDMNDKRAGRLNVIAHLLSRVPYRDLTPAALALPERQAPKGYEPPDWSHLEIPRAYA